MTDSDKEQYNDMAADDKVRYQEAMAAYTPKAGGGDDDL